MSFYKLNGQPASDGGLDDSGAAGSSLQQGAGNSSPDAASIGSGPAGSSTAPGSGVLTFVSDDGGPPPDNTTAVTTSQTVTFANSGLVFNNTYTGTVSAAYQSCVLSAEQALANICTNAVTINVEFDAQAEGQNGELASNEFWTVSESYASLKTALTSLSSTEPGNTILQQAVAHLPSTDPSSGKGFELPLPYARMLGLSTSSRSPEDIVTLNTSYNWSFGQDVINTLEHEISEGGMGRIGGLGDQNSFWSTMDLFRYNAAGQPDYTDGRDGQTTFFSYNGGGTLSTLAFNNEFNAHNVEVNGGDTADYIQQDVFGTGDPGETNTLSATDIQNMEALGWAPPSSETVIRTDANAFGSVDLAQVGNNYFLYAHGTTTGPELKYAGAPATVGEFGSWTPLGAAITSAGYDVAWQLPGTNDYTVWQTDSGGNFLSSGGVVTGNSNTFEAYELILNQDLNGDGIIGVTDTNAFGSTTLSEVANDYALSSGGGSVTLQFNGAPVTTHEFAWTPVGAALTAAGYDVAWEVPGANQYTVWQTDSSGTFLSSLGVVAGNSNTFEAYEMIFNQDLNGDGIIGVTDTNAFGSTTLSEAANQFSISNGGGSVTLQYNGAPVTAGEFGAWTPIGAVRTAAGYDVAWEVPGANQYTVWQIDSGGNFLSSLGLVAGNSNAFESYELVFNQDLNGDGTIGVTDTNGFGSTTLSEVANKYSISSGGGSVTLEDNGAAVTAGEFGTWTPFGAARTSTGYDVVWEVPGANQYTAWAIDFSGNFVSNLTGGVGVPGNNSEIIQLESVLNQDLNGNGTTGGAPSATIQSEDALSSSSTEAATAPVTDAADTSPAPDWDAGSSSSTSLALLDPTSAGLSGGWDDFNAQGLTGEPPQNDSSPLYSLSDFDFAGDGGSGSTGLSALQPSAPQAGAVLDPAGSNGVAGTQFGAPSLSSLGLAAGLGASAADNSASIEPPATPTLTIAGLLHT